MFEFRLLTVVAVGTVAATLVSGAEGQYTDVPVTEYVTLPKFCWYEFSGGTANAGTGPDTQFTNCGPRVNHYCYGLLDLQRSKKATNIAIRQQLLRRARENTVYTLNGLRMEGTMATCSITAHVQSTMRTIDLQMQIYNMKSK